MTFILQNDGAQAQLFPLPCILFFCRCRLTWTSCNSVGEYAARGLAVLLCARCFPFSSFLSCVSMHGMKALWKHTWKHTRDESSVSRNLVGVCFSIFDLPYCYTLLHMTSHIVTRYFTVFVLLALYWRNSNTAQIIKQCTNWAIQIVHKLSNCEYTNWASQSDEGACVLKTVFNLDGWSIYSQNHFLCLLAPSASCLYWPKIRFQASAKDAVYDKVASAFSSSERSLNNSGMVMALNVPRAP